MNRAARLLTSFVSMALWVGASRAPWETPPNPGVVRAAFATQVPASGPAAAFFLTMASNSTGANIAADGNGGVHVAFSAYGPAGDGTYPAYYAYCHLNCAKQVNWTVARLGDMGYLGGYARLAVNAQGQPRAMWVHQADIYTAEYRYAECNAQCTNSANWTNISVAGEDFTDNSRYFALDAQGRPRFLYRDSYGHTFYRYCNSSCTSPVNWAETQVSTEPLYNFSLAFTASGQPRFAFLTVTPSPDTFGYFACDASCTNSANWANTLLYAAGSGRSISLRLDNNDRPRLAFYQGYLGSGQPNDFVYYAWCNANCTQATGWDAWDLGLPPEYGAGADLAFDNQNRPRMAYYVGTAGYGLAYSGCTANCESHSPTWVSQWVETAAALNASDPVPPQPGCSLSSWYPGKRPALVLDAAGSPVFGYDAEHLQGGTCAAHTDILLVRYASFGMPYALYLPLTQR